MATGTFPLLLLPDSARVNVLRNFDHYKLFDTSFISKRMKAIVKDLNLQINSFTLVVPDGASTLFLRIPPYGAMNYWRMREYDDEGFSESSVHLHSPRSRWKKKGYLLKDYVGHFLDVLNKNALDSMSFLQEENQFDFDVLQNGIPNATGIMIGRSFSVESLYRIVSSFLCARKLLYSGTKPLNKKLPKVFIQNFDILSSGLGINTWHLSFDELLEMNSAQIEIHLTSICAKMLNRLLKMWVKGGSPRLKFLEFLFSRGPSQETILKGIKHRVVEQERQFEVFHEDRETVRRITVTGGVDVRRTNGTVGTIVFEDRGNGSVAMRLFVWH